MVPPPTDVDAFLPLRPLELLVLTMVAESPLHGYGIRQAILEQTDNHIEVEAGNLYRHIRRLHSEDLLEVVDGEEDDGDERRRYFAPTPLGLRVLSAELKRLAALVKFAEDRRIVRPARA